MKLKICGITNKEDLNYLIALNVDAVGFIFVEDSPRFVTPEVVEELTYMLPPFINTVGVFANQSVDKINQISEKCNLSYVQLHGSESSSDCLKINRPVIKAFHVEGPDDLVEIDKYQGTVTSILLDTKSKDKLGGTGETFDWGLAVKAKTFEIPMILSGGINKDNIQKAIRVVNPYALDISSGVESSPGKKDYNKIKEIVEIIKAT